jgi:hypothetical protein
MYRKHPRAAARAAALGGTLVLGLGTAQAAMAQPPPTVHVPCHDGALAAAISDATSGETIVLAGGASTRLDQALPDVEEDLTIVGLDTELLRDHGAPSFSLLTVGPLTDLTVINVDFKNGGGPDDDYGGAIYADDNDYMHLTGSTFTGNSAYQGGAVYNADHLVMASDTLSGNAADEGGGIFNGWDLSVYGSLIDFNRASDDGGGIYNVYDITAAGNQIYGNQPDNCVDVSGCFG